MMVGMGANNHWINIGGVNWDVKSLTQITTNDNPMSQ